MRARGPGLGCVWKSTGPTTAEILITHPVDLARAQTWRIDSGSAAPTRGPDPVPTARNASGSTCRPRAR